MTATSSACVAGLQLSHFKGVSILIPDGLLCSTLLCFWLLPQISLLVLLIGVLLAFSRHSSALVGGLVGTLAVCIVAANRALLP